jgi:A/G-specific adenine glycosylase
MALFFYYSFNIFWQSVFKRSKTLNGIISLLSIILKLHMNNLILTNKILYWYDNNKRSLPWRGRYSQKKREYYTLISEFMLQQTQVSTVIPYFKNFIKDIPDLNSLAKINEKKIIKVLGRSWVLFKSKKFKKNCKNRG